PIDPAAIYRVIELPAHAPINAVQIRDMLDSQTLYAANEDSQETAIGVRLRVDSEADIDDFSSYIWRPHLDREFILPVEAYEKVEMMVVTNSDLAPEQLPVIA